jgi:hypothetical protein
VELFGVTIVKVVLPQRILDDDVTVFSRTRSPSTSTEFRLPVSVTLNAVLDTSNTACSRDIPGSGMRMPTAPRPRWW